MMMSEQQSPEVKMVETLEDVQQVREMAARLEQLGAPRKATDRIRRWVKGEAKRLRDEARPNARGGE